MAHTNRYELKYVIDEPKAVAIRRFLSAHLRPSPHDGNPSLTVPAGGVQPAPDRPPYYLPRAGVGQAAAEPVRARAPGDQAMG